MDDLGIEIVTKRVSSKIADALKISKVFICCLTKNYCETINLGDIYAQGTVVGQIRKKIFV